MEGHVRPTRSRPSKISRIEPGFVVLAPFAEPHRVERPRKCGAVALIRFCTNAPSRLHYNARPDEDLLYQVDASHFRRYDPSTDPVPIHSKADVAGARLDLVNAVAVETESPSEFAYESDLRDFLARNLSVIEAGLQLYREEGITGVEFPAGGRFIDILALDTEKRLVVIELKVSKGYDRVVGQLLRYMAWIEQHHAEPGQGVAVTTNQPMQRTRGEQA